MSLIPLMLVAALVFWGILSPPREAPVAPPQRPADESSAGEAVELAVGAVATLAGLCWALIWLAVFLAPLALVILWVAR